MANEKTQHEQKQRLLNEIKEKVAVDDPEGLIFSTKGMATLLGVSVHWVRQLVADGIIDKAGRGRFDLVKTIQDYKKYQQKLLENERQQGDSKQDLEGEKYFHEKAKRQMSELKLAAMEGSMHDGQEVERVWTNMLMNMKGKLLSIPTKVAPQLIARDDVALIQDMLQTEIYEALQELSEYDATDYHSKDYVEIEGEEEPGQVKEDGQN